MKKIKFCEEKINFRKTIFCQKKKIVQAELLFFLKYFPKKNGLEK